MDENQNSLTHSDLENSHIMQQLSNAIKQIAIDHNDYGLDLSHESKISCCDNVDLKRSRTHENLYLESENPHITSNILAHADVNMLLDSREDIKDQNAMMLFTDLPSTSNYQGCAKISSPHETKQQNMHMPAAKDDDCQLTFGCFAGHEDKNQNRSYQSYSNLIQMFCRKCQIASNNITDYQCYKCQSPLRFQCKKCNGLYKKYIGILNHIKYECYKVPAFYCSICIYTTCRRTSLVKHIQKNHSALDQPQHSHQCSVCQKKFKHLQYMLKHEKICNREATLECPYCPYKTKLNQVLMQHLERKHQQKMTDCKHPNSSKKYKGPKALRQHVKSIKKLFECEHCDVKIDRKFALVKHIKKVHPFLYKRFNL